MSVVMEHYTPQNFRGWGRETLWCACDSYIPRPLTKISTKFHIASNCLLSAFESCRPKNAENLGKIRQKIRGGAYHDQFRKLSSPVDMALRDAKSDP